ncbi:PXMP2/4 family protein 2-like [Tubulanus polymorphus]|uniref:PXMP2/4 family protein 2-like n=1 Tax=Tubulanus polymorphus TaxID=672921 RepID=UPI003DA2F8B6
MFPAVRAFVRTTTTMVLSKTPPRVKRTFNKVFGKYLLITNMSLATTSALTADFLQQKYEIYCDRQDGLDKNRSKNIGCSSLISSPLLHYWYIGLDVLFPGTGARVLVKKILLDNVIGIPADIVCFLSIMSYLEGKSFQNFKSSLLEKGKEIFTIEILVCAPAAVVRFGLIPLRFRVAFDSALTLCFDYLYSYVYFKKHDPEDETILDIISSHSEDDPLAHGTTGGHIMKISARC